MSCEDTGESQEKVFVLKPRVINDEPFHPMADLLQEKWLTNSNSNKKNNQAMKTGGLLSPHSSTAEGFSTKMIKEVLACLKSNVCFSQKKS